MTEPQQPPAAAEMAPGEQPPPAATEPPAPTEKDWKAEAEKWKAMSRETEKKADANAKRIKEIEDRDLSELDRAKKEAAETAAELADIRRQNAFLSKGISADLIPPATGSAQDMAAYADRLLAWKGTPPAVAVPVVPGQPKPDPSQGAGQLPDASAAEQAAYEQIAASNWGHLHPQPRK